MHAVRTHRRNRSDKEQESLLAVQDKVLAGLRAVSSSSLTPDLHRAVRAALLPLVTQPGFIKKVAFAEQGSRSYLRRRLVSPSLARSRARPACLIVKHVVFNRLRDSEGRIPNLLTLRGHATLG